MKKGFWQIMLAMFLIAVLLSACDLESEKDVLAPAESIIETTEPELEAEWVSENAIAEAYACLFPADGGEKDVALAQEILLPLVEAGNAEAQYYWAYIYDWEIVDNDGEGEKESLYWHNLAIEQGFAKSYLAAAMNTYVESEAKANELVEMARQAGLFEMPPEELGADGFEMIGSYYYNKEDYDNAIVWLTKAADMGSAVAMTHLGYMYYSGKGVTQNDTIALAWLEKAADLGNEAAMTVLVALYLSRGDENGSVKWCKKASNVGDATAMYLMGYFYYSGYGVEKNDGKAQRWFEKAANAGDATSMYWAGWFKLEKRYGSEQELNDGMAWCMKAYANGEDDVVEYINESLKAKRGVNGYFENYGELISLKP